jgi:uncharacterized protein with von Willebrand factor type A (vWA) domain
LFCFVFGFGFVCDFVIKFFHRFCLTPQKKKKKKKKKKGLTPPTPPQPLAPLIEAVDAAHQICAELLSAGPTGALSRALRRLAAALRHGGGNITSAADPAAAGPAAVPAARSVLLQRPSQTGSIRFLSNDLHPKPEQEIELRKVCGF